jgi:uncharacterized protein with NAD-binding domain and iron-sulfur cluster
VEVDFRLEILDEQDDDQGEANLVVVFQVQKEVFDERESLLVTQNFLHLGALQDEKKNLIPMIKKDLNLKRQNDDLVDQKAHILKKKKQCDDEEIIFQIQKEALVERKKLFDEKEKHLVAQNLKTKKVLVTQNLAKKRIFLIQKPKENFLLNQNLTPQKNLQKNREPDLRKSSDRF